MRMYPGFDLKRFESVTDYKRQPRHASLRRNFALIAGVVSNSQTLRTQLAFKISTFQIERSGVVVNKY